MGGPRNIKKGTKGFITRPIEERFWERVRKTESCWLWTGTLGRNGYGIIHVGNKKKRASRLSWELFPGQPFPADKLACHTCDNPPCVNPEHIWVGDHHDNAMDARRKGRLRMPLEKGARPWNEGKTHCKRGHELSGTNLYKFPDGRRACRECARMHRQAYENREALAPKPSEAGGT